MESLIRNGLMFNLVFFEMGWGLRCVQCCLLPEIQLPTSTHQFQVSPINSKNHTSIPSITHQTRLEAYRLPFTIRPRYSLHIIRNFVLVQQLKTAHRCASKLKVPLSSLYEEAKGEWVASDICVRQLGYGQWTTKDMNGPVTGSRPQSQVNLHSAK
jgi:hypothetical protein